MVSGNVVASRNAPGEDAARRGIIRRENRRSFPRPGLLEDIVATGPLTLTQAFVLIPGITYDILSPGVYIVLVTVRWNVASVDPGNLNVELFQNGATLGSTVGPSYNPHSTTGDEARSYAWVVTVDGSTLPTTVQARARKTNAGGSASVTQFGTSIIVAGYIGGGPPGSSGGVAHDAVTLAAAADVLLALSGQEIDLDTQDANTVLAGPASAPAAAPTMRVLVEADIPPLAAYVTKALFDANTFLYATDDDIPAAKTRAQVMALLSAQAASAFSMNTQQISGVVDPTLAQDAATKAYVDARKQLKTVPFAATQEDAQVETMLRLPGICIGESGDMGTAAGVRFKVSCGVAGVTGTMTVKLYADSAPDFPSETEIASVDLTTGIEGDDTTITGWVPGTDNWLRAKITAIHSGTPAKNVAADFYFEVTPHS